MKFNFTSIMLSGAAAAAMLLLAGCAKENGLNQVDKSCAELELTDVNSGEMLSKAAIDGTGFPRDGRIGLFFFKDEAGAELYGDSSCSNAEYSYNQDKSKWTASPAIRVGSTPGYLYGYYPYNDANKDVKAIAVESSFDGDDVMYVAKQGPVTDQTAGNVAITMRHALARVSITVKNKGYSGAAKLSRIEFVGAKTAPSGTLNALDGSITATKSDVTLEVPEANQDITAAGTRYECLLVPSEVDASAQNVTLRLTIDGQQKTVSLTGENAMKIVSGVKARLTLDLSDSGLSVVDGGIQIDDWQAITVGGHTVTVKFSEDVADAGIADNLYTQISVSNDNITIGAYSKEVKPLIIRIDDCTLIAPVESGNFSTFTISDITEDITATLAYAKIFTVKASFNADFMPNVEGYPNDFGKSKEFIEGRKNIFKVDNVGGYKLDSLVCGKTKSVVASIDLKNISADTEVKAYYTYTDWLGGVFSVSKGTKVRFSRGNLWCAGTKSNATPRIESWGFETSQYSTQSNRTINHISHFIWCKSASESVKLRYEEQGTTVSDNLFTNASPTEPNENFAVNGQKGFWRALSGGDNGEWQYLIDRKDSEGNALYKPGVKVCDRTNCLILLPDDWKWGENGVGSDWYSEYNESTTVKWSTMEAAGAVCLPAAGYRNSSVNDAARVVDVLGGHYWSSTLYDRDRAYYLEFRSGNVNPANNRYRYYACAVRLVTECQ